MMKKIPKLIQTEREITIFFNSLLKKKDKDIANQTNIHTDYNSHVTSPGHKTIKIMFQYNGRTVLKKSIEINLIPDFHDYANALIDEVIESAKKIESILVDFENNLADITFQTTPFEFNVHDTGACTYPSMGHTRYAYVYLQNKDVYLHNQWLKVYVRKGVLDIDKTFKQLTKEYKKSSKEGQLPPNVWLLQSGYHQHARKYVADNAEKLVKDIESLPFNKTGMREDYQWKDCYIVIGDTQDTLDHNRNRKTVNVVRNLENGELQDPTSDLFVMVRHDSYYKKISGFAKRIDDDNSKSFEVLGSIQNAKYNHDYRNPSKNIDMDEGSVIKGYYNSYSKAISSYLIGDKIDEEDGYIDFLLNRELENWNV
jgi:hypothetical protein